MAEYLVGNISLQAENLGNEHATALTMVLVNYD